MFVTMAGRNVQLTLCNWCGQRLLPQDDETEPTLCLRCCLRFENHPCWDDEAPERTIAFDNLDQYSDSCGPPSCTGGSFSARSTADTEAESSSSLPAHLHGREEGLYDKIHDCVIQIGNRTPVPVESELWLTLHMNPYLSSAWVQHTDEPLRHFGDSPMDFRILMLSLGYDVPMGCVLINLARKRSYAINGHAYASNISVRSGLHFIRNYGSQSLGFVFWHHRGRYEIACLEANRGPNPSRDKRRLINKLNERVLKILVLKFKHVAFWNGEPSSEK